MKIYKDFSDVFMAINYFEGMFKLQVREGSHPYQALPRRVAHALQEPLQDELDRLQTQEVIIHLDINETSKWCKSFMLVPKANDRVRLCLDLAWLNEVLKRPIHRDLTLDGILPRLADVKYITLINMTEGYHNLKPDEQSSYLITFSCPFGRYMWIPFGVVPVGDMFQRWTEQGAKDMQADQPKN